MSAGNGHCYRTYVFDCDGVILDSNALKTEAFRTVGLPYGEAAADALAAHHVANGGISRIAKFRHFLGEIVPAGSPGPGFDELLERYARVIRQEMLECAVVPGLHALREATADARWLVVSGTLQGELREILAERGLADLFDGGIFGSPDDKDTILARELAGGTIAGPALFIGDSTYDWRAASAAGLDFVFASYWTEVPDWPAFTAANGIDVIDSIELLQQRKPG